jgi:hypothetical protein
MHILAEMILWLVFEYIFYFTGRWLLPLASFGHLRVLPFTAANLPGWGFDRLANGKVVVDPITAGIIGIIFWLIFFGGVIWYFGNR